ncbi:MAG TPA: hypothetical protein VH277_07050, partial [Gemmatimonadaceae bacterium]|nr:hypothetical protein [Gemmatimonadaceae bacterium]
MVSPTVPLSSRERDELLTRGSWLPALVVLIALAASITLPRIGVERITAFRNEISANIEPARLLLAKIQLDLALQGTQRRGFLLTGDGGVESEEGLTRSDRVAAEQQLVGLARRLDRSSG